MAQASRTKRGIIAKLLAVFFLQVSQEIDAGILGVQGVDRGAGQGFQDDTGILRASSVGLDDAIFALDFDGFIQCSFYRAVLVFG
jgi:hypothetical protein